MKNVVQPMFTSELITWVFTGSSGQIPSTKRELTAKDAKDAKDAKETTIEEVRCFDSKQRVKQQYPPYQKTSFLTSRP